MQTAALILSLLALTVAVASAAFSGVQASAARESARIDAARRHQERTPKVVAEIERVNDGSWFRLWLTLETSETLDSLSVDLPERSGIALTLGQIGVEPNSSGLHGTSRQGPIAPGDRICWGVRLDESNYVESIRLRVNAVCGEAKWTGQVPLQVPYTGIGIY